MNDNEDEFKMLTTAEAAKLLNRKEQTLRSWSHYGNGALSPIKVNGRLMWSLEKIKKLLRGESVD